MRTDDQSNPYLKLSSFNTREYIALKSGDTLSEVPEKAKPKPKAMAAPFTVSAWRPVGIWARARTRVYVEQVHITRTSRPVVITTTMTWKNPETLTRHAATQLIPGGSDSNDEQKSTKTNLGGVQIPCLAAVAPSAGAPLGPLWCPAGVRTHVNT